MQVQHTHTKTQVQSRFSWFLALTFAGIIAVLIIWLAVYGFILDRNIQSINKDIITIDQQIQLASTDRKIILTKILQSTVIRPSLDISGLIREFQKVAIASNVRLQWFSVANDVISTSLIATTGDPQIHPDPVSTIIKMMREYARGEKYFSLDPISTISGDPTSRTTSIQLKVVGKTY